MIQVTLGRSITSCRHIGTQENASFQFGEITEDGCAFLEESEKSSLEVDTVTAALYLMGHVAL